ncbi:MAG: tetratricopeptide repeat protein [Acidobacteriota bacterium]
MNKEDIEKILDEALEHYKSARYADAARRWKDVLALDPFNKQAQEGIRMAELLSQEWIAEEEGGAEKPAKTEEPLQLVENLGIEEILEKGKAENAKQIQWSEKERPKGETEETVTLQEEEEKTENESKVKAESGVNLLLSEGERLLQEARYSEAADCFSRALVMDESNYRSQELLNLARNLIDEKQKETERKLHQGMELFEKGDFQSAENLFREILSTNPAHQEALFYIGRIEKEREKINSMPSIGLEKKEKEKPAGKSGKVRERETSSEATIKVSRSTPRRGTIHVEVPVPVKLKKPIFARIVLIAAPILFVVAGFYFARYIIERFYFYDEPAKQSFAPRTEGERGAESVGIGGVAGKAGQQKKVATPEKAKADEGTPLQKEAAAVVPTGTEKVPEPQRTGPLTPSLMKSKTNSLLHEGKSLMRAGRSIEAEDKFREATILDPLNMEAKKLLEEASRVAGEERKYFNRLNEAEKYFQNGNYAEALRIFY